MILDAFADSLPMAVGAALSPIPIAAAVSILLSKKPGNAMAFLSGWVTGILAIGAAVFVIPGLETSRGDPTPLAGWLRLVFGAGLFFLAVKSWRNRPAASDTIEPPKVLAGLDSSGFGQSVMLGLALSVLNPKNLVLTLAGAGAIVYATETAKQQAGGLAIYTLVASLGVIVPVVGFFLFTEKVRPALDALKDWLIRNNTAVKITLLIVFGAVLISNGLEVLAA